MTAPTGDLRRARRVARTQLGFEQLRPEQEEAVRSVLDGRDTLLVMPTGGGKSAVYQVAGALLDGPTIVISPLIALQRDQVETIESADLGEVALVNSHQRRGDLANSLERAEELDFLFMAPEQFSDEEKLQQLAEAKPALFVVDEAHCISEWGDSFRPDYLRLGAVVEAFGRPPVLALTATASPRVREEIVERLGMRTPAVVVRGFDRPNIWLGVERYHDAEVKRRDLIARTIAEPKPGIVYAATRKHTEEIAEALRGEGVKAAAYHAGMNAHDRQETQDAFMAGEREVIVATSAFGMGIDKPDVRFVFHLDVPESVDLYYQEIGRAGRDGEPARAVLFYRPEDLHIHHFFGGSGQIDEELVERVLDTLDGEDGPVATAELQEETDLSRAKLTTAINRLEEIGAVEVLPTGEILEVASVETGEDLAEEAVEAEERRRAADRSRIEMMRAYAELHDCRREFLLNYFGELYDPPCNACDVCDAGEETPEGEDDVLFPIHSRVRHSTLGEGIVERYDGDSMTVLFDDGGHKQLLVEFMREGGVLTEVSGAPVAGS